MALWGENELSLSQTQHRALGCGLWSVPPTDPHSLPLITSGEACSPSADCHYCQSSLVTGETAAITSGQWPTAFPVDHAQHKIIHNQYFSVTETAAQAG